MSDIDLPEIIEEPLVKMALIHEDEEKPLMVYRVMNALGHGPYNNYFDKRLKNLENEGGFRRTGTPGTKTRIPDRDFTTEEQMDMWNARPRTIGRIH
jgi:hypothetical protein